MKLHSSKTSALYYLQHLIMVVALFFLFSNSSKAVVVTMETSLGNIDIELFDDTPITRDNFLSYIESGAYNDSFFHRSVPGFIVQGGGFKFESGNNSPTQIEQNDPIVNEFGRLNVRGTIAMAKLGGDPDSATNQWFFNLNDNNNLDTQNGGFTVFGQVLGNGMDVVDDIAALGTYDFGGAFGDLPLFNDPSTISGGFNAERDLVQLNKVSAVPVPATVYLFSSAIFGLVGWSRKTA